MNFFIPYVFEVKESIPRCFSKQSCPIDLENPDQLPVLQVLEGTAKRDTDRLYSLLPSLTELTSVRNLGFIIDQELNMKDHITKLCQSCYYQLRQIRTVRHSLTSSAIQTLVHAFICTRVDFSNSLLYGTSAYLLGRLQSVLNSAARLILRIGKYDPISAAIRRDLHWLPIQFRVQYKLNSITSNCLAGRAPEYLIELYHSVNDIPARRNLRSSSQVQLLVPRYRKERSGRRGFSVSSPQLWIYFLLTFDFSTMNINFSGRDLELIICNSPCYATEDRCHQCELYYYYYYYYYWWWYRLIDSRNFITLYVLEVTESISAVLSELRYSNDLENPGQHPVSEVLEGTDDWVLRFFVISQFLTFSGSRNPFLDVSRSYHVRVTPKI